MSLLGWRLIGVASIDHVMVDFKTNLRFGLLLPLALLLVQALSDLLASRLWYGIYLQLLHLSLFVLDRDEILGSEGKVYFYSRLFTQFV